MCDERRELFFLGQHVMWLSAGSELVSVAAASVLGGGRTGRGEKEFGGYSDNDDDDEMTGLGCV